ncbi:MAG: hypothetical protein KAR06_07430 [Deltaproteobacteria bacterium]|nr:hypothetical protein [Deltaproteobacteria bacterium]
MDFEYNQAMKTQRAYIIFLILATLAITGCEGGTPIEGTPASDLVLKPISTTQAQNDNSETSIKKLQGRPILLYFFASW